MSFYHRPSVGPVVSSRALMDRYITDKKSGIVRKESVSASPSLPSPELYDLERMIEAGLDVRKVSTNLLRGDLIPLETETETETEIETKTETEIEEK